MSTENVNMQQFNSSPEDKELNQYITEVIIPTTTASGVPQSPLFSSKVNTSTLQPSYMFSSVSFAEGQKRDISPVHVENKKQKALNESTTTKVSMSERNYDTSEVKTDSKPEAITSKNIKTKM